MAIDFSQVKTITIPEGSVKKITDSNGAVLWANKTAFPYRRLQYIKFSGAEYVDTNVTLPAGNSYKRFDLAINWQDASNWGVNGFDSDTSNRFNIGVNGSGHSRYGSGSTNTWADSDGYNISLNTKYDLVLLASKGSTNLAFLQNGINIWTSPTRSTTFNSATGNIYIGAALYKGEAKNFNKELIYGAVLRVNNVSGVIFNGVPVQRKSDGVCGLYDTVSGIFRPMQGTTITDAAAGPIVDEYWNLQA